MTEPPPLMPADPSEVIVVVHRRNSMATPTIGRIVHYELSAYDVDQIRVQHPQIWEARAASNLPHAGDVYPAEIVRVWADTPDAAVNLRVHLDGVYDYWATSRQLATDEQKAGRWFWPPRV